jgi:hypothetical protein
LSGIDHLQFPCPIISHIAITGRRVSNKNRSISGYIRLNRLIKYIAFKSLDEARFFAFEHNEWYQEFLDLFKFLGERTWDFVAMKSQDSGIYPIPQLTFEESTFAYIEHWNPDDSDQISGAVVHSLLSVNGKSYYFTITPGGGTLESTLIITKLDDNTITLSFISISSDTSFNEMTFMRGTTK